jgi:hypothetical protein
MECSAEVEENRFVPFVASWFILSRLADVSRTIAAMDVEIRNQLRPGARVKVTQQIAARDYTLTSEVRGTITAFEQKPTGSWFAHSKDDRLWLDRLTLRKDDGEVTTLNLDAASRVEIEAPATAGAAKGVSE